MDVTDDGHYGILYRYLGTHGTAIKILDRQKEKAEWKDVIIDFTYDHTVIGNTENQLILLTNQNAPKQKVVLVDVNNPAPENWNTIIPESEHTLRSATAVGNKLVANYMQDASTRIKVFSRKGAF